MGKQNNVHRDGYNLTMKPCSISKRNIGWRKPYTEMEKHLANKRVRLPIKSEKCTKTLWFIQDKTSNQRTKPLILVYIAYLVHIYFK